MEQGTTHPYVLSVRPLTSVLFAFFSFFLLILPAGCSLLMSPVIVILKKEAEPALFSLTISFNTFCGWR